MKYRKYQMGGEVAAPQEQQDPMAELSAMAEQVVQQLGAEGAMQLAQMIMELAQGGQEQPQEVAPQEAPAPQFKKGGKAPKMKMGNKIKC